MPATARSTWNDSSVSHGEVVGVVGANGAGKSTLVNALAGWSRGEPRVRGEIVLDGRACR